MSTVVARAAEVRTLLSSVRALFFDCDGVLWHGEQIVPGAAAAITHLRKQGKQLFFVTNNSTRSRRSYLEKFVKLGIDARVEEIYGSSYAAASYLASIDFAKRNKKVYVVGEQGIVDELTEKGFQCLGGLEHKGVESDFTSSMTVDPDVGAVVVGFDRHINYHKITYAQTCLTNNDNCLFVATNLDATAHFVPNQLWPAGGVMVAAIQASTCRTPIVAGKPSPILVDLILKEHGLSANEVCMVGDRLDTDILFGKRNGLKACLTLSGVTDLQMLKEADAEMQPDVVIESIADLVVESTP
eukprot:m.103019 g.103019  ORF g.103019 m.103019 type:complete len:299 (-) comp15707_c2_seq1:273-1169(-)